jgi:hypothetical protein
MAKMGAGPVQSSQPPAAITTAAQSILQYQVLFVRHAQQPAQLIPVKKEADTSPMLTAAIIIIIRICNDWL